MLVTQRRGVLGGSAAANSHAIWLTTATTTGRERVKRRPATRGRSAGSIFCCAQSRGRPGSTADWARYWNSSIPADLSELRSTSSADFSTSASDRNGVVPLHHTESI